GVTAAELQGLDREAIIAEFLDDALDAYAEREKELESLDAGLMREAERFMVLQVVDMRWREHLENMDYMREGIHLRGMAQKDPLVEYRNEGHVMFLELNRTIREEVIAFLFHVEIATDAAALEQQQRNGQSNGQLSYEHTQLAGAEAIAAAGGGTATALSPGATGGVATRPVVKSEQQQVGRNDPCWCGSGKKFKRCHGA